MNATQPAPQPSKPLRWVDDVSRPRLRLIGVVEILGAIGLILPAVTGIAPILTPIAAVGLAAIMVLADTTHIRCKNEAQAVIFDIVLFILSFIVAWGRFGPYAP